MTFTPFAPVGLEPRGFRAVATLLDVEGFKARTIMPKADVDALEADSPGWLDRRITVAIGWIEGKLKKRYAVPFAAPAPEAILGWIVAIVTPEAYRRRGWVATDEQAAQIEQDRKDARDQVQEAADAVNGLWDLPLRQDSTESGIAHGGPIVYSEPDPYSWTDVQSEAIRGR